MVFRREWSYQKGSVHSEYKQYYASSNLRSNKDNSLTQDRENEPLKGIFRGGKSDAGDVSLYPQDQYSSSGKPLKDFLNRLHHGINLGVLKRQMMKA